MTYHMVNCACCNPEDGCVKVNPLTCGYCDFGLNESMLTCAGDEIQPWNPPQFVTIPSNCPSTIAITIVQPTQTVKSTAASYPVGDVECCNSSLFPNWEKTFVATRSGSSSYGSDCAWGFSGDIFDCEPEATLFNCTSGTYCHRRNTIDNEACCEGSCSGSGTNEFCFAGIAAGDIPELIEDQFEDCLGGAGMAGRVFCPFDDHCITYNSPCTDDSLECDGLGYCDGQLYVDSQYCFLDKLSVVGTVKRIPIEDLKSQCVTQGTHPPYSVWEMTMTYSISGNCKTWTNNKCYECDYRNRHRGAYPTWNIEGFRGQGGGDAPTYSTTYEGGWQKYKFQWINYECGCPFTPDCYATQCCNLYGDVDNCENGMSTLCGFSYCTGSSSLGLPLSVWNGAIPSISIA